MNPSLLDNVAVVLVDTKAPANIGATARCMMNMGLSRLILVNPPQDRTGEARKLAAGADAVLAGATIAGSLREAVAGHQLVTGATRHRGRLRKNMRSPRETAAAIAPLLPANRVALVFGDEVNGLTREDLALCTDLVRIPAADAFPSLNLSHAVLIVAYELALAVAAGAVPDAPRTLATAAEREGFYEHLQTTLVTLGFLDPAHPDRVLFLFRQLFGRAQPDAQEIALLRGLLTAAARGPRPEG